MEKRQTQQSWGETLIQIVLLCDHWCLQPAVVDKACSIFKEVLTASFKNESHVEGEPSAKELLEATL
jgi:hypothetical protein